jgi:hypothetical protein
VRKTAPALRRVVRGLATCLAANPTVGVT